MAVAAPSTLPMKLWRTEQPRGKAAAGSDDPVRVLVTVTVLGSAGPLRIIVCEGDTVAVLIRAALRCYAREGRMAVLGSDPAAFVLSTANGGSGVLKDDEKITFNGCRSFLLWQKAAAGQDAGFDTLTVTPSPGTRGSGGCKAPSSPGRKGGGGGWKAGLNKFLLSFSFKV